MFNATKKQGACKSWGELMPRIFDNIDEYLSPALKQSLSRAYRSDFCVGYMVTSNVRHLNPFDVQNFPLPESALNDGRVKQLGSEYLEDMDRNSLMLQRKQKQTGLTETQSFKIQKSKPIIEEIDKVLAEHYGFTDEELDYIINYDIKYRMGKDLQEDEE
jgi:hypothetical protein